MRSHFFMMGHLSGRKTRNGTSYGKSAAYGYERTEPDISSHTKKVSFNQAVFSGRKIIPQISNRKWGSGHAIEKLSARRAGAACGTFLDILTSRIISVSVEGL